METLKKAYNNYTNIFLIVDYYSYDPAINTDYFSNTESSFYWSSSNVRDTDESWIVNFKLGYVIGSAKSSDYDGFNVRAVRLGEVDNIESCFFEIEPPSKDFSASGGIQGVSIDASGEDCAWSVSEDFGSGSGQGGIVNNQLLFPLFAGQCFKERNNLHSQV